MTALASAKLRPAKAQAEHWIPKVRKEFDRFEGSLRSSLAVAIDLGKQLIAAKEALPHGEFGRLFAEHDDAAADAVRFSQSWANKVMRIASNQAISNSEHAPNLPADLTAVFELACMSAPALEAAIEAGKVTPQTTRAEAKAIRAESEPEKEKRERPARRESAKSRDAVYADCQQSIDDAIAEAISMFPELKAAISAHLRLLVKEMSQSFAKEAQEDQ